MPQSSQLDSLEFNDLSFPYDRAAGELGDKPRIVDGRNLLVTFGNKLRKRLGALKINNTNLTTRARRLIAYETLDNPPKIFYLASVETTVGSGVYKVRYINLDDVTPAWADIAALRQINSSTRPHELVVHKGKVYIKGYPTGASGEKLGSVLWEAPGGTPSTKLWGLIGPTTPASVAAPGSWTLTTNKHAVNVRFGWKYTYAWVTSTGQVSSRAPLQTNPDKNPSNTGAFNFAALAGKCPEVVVQGTADTTNIPNINIYRTTDGGGTFYFVKQIANTGAGNITFVDKFLESGAGGGTFEDPLPDTALDLTRVAPTTTSNDPPPPVAAPRVVGTDTPDPSTPIVSWNGRLWYGIDNFVYYSAVEEINDGVGEESFPSGTFGNSFKAHSPIRGFGPTEDALYVYTQSATYIITGSTKDTFDFRVLLHKIGAPPSQPLAVTTINGEAAWVTHDYRVALIGPGGFRILSDPLSTDLVDAVTAGGELQLTHWAELDKDYLIVWSHRIDATTNSKQWVLDVKRSFSPRGTTPFWFPPWTVRSTIATSGKLQQNVINNRLLALVWNNTANQADLVRLDSTTYTDHIPSTGAAGFTWYFDLFLMGIPSGNHVNEISKPHRTPEVKNITLNRTIFSGDVDPVVYYYTDDFWTTAKPAQAVPDIPPRRRESRSYKTLHVQIDEAAQKFAFRLQHLNSKIGFELHSFSVAWNPGSGTGPGGGL